MTESRVLRLYERSTKVPVVGRQLFSTAFAFQAPYFLSVQPYMVDLRPNYCEVRLRKWWAVQNHIGTVHVIAVANAMEAAMGALAEATVPAHLRWIPKGMNLDYTAKADSTLQVIAESDPADWRQPGDVPVRVTAIRKDGTVVVEGVIRLYVSEKPKKA